MYGEATCMKRIECFDVRHAPCVVMVVRSSTLPLAFKPMIRHKNADNCHVYVKLGTASIFQCLSTVRDTA